MIRSDASLKDLEREQERLTKLREELRQKANERRSQWETREAWDNIRKIDKRLEELPLEIALAEYRERKSRGDASSGYGNYYDEPKQGATKRYKGHEYSAYSPIRGFWSAIISGPYARSHGEIEARSQAQALQYAREVIDEEIAKKTRRDDASWDDVGVGVVSYGKRHKYKGYEFQVYRVSRAYWSAEIWDPSGRRISRAEVEAGSKSDAMTRSRNSIDREIARRGHDAVSRFDSAIERIHALDTRLRRL